MIDLLSQFDPIFPEVAEIMEARQQIPGVIRQAAEVARLDENASETSAAIAMLVERRLLPTLQPTVDELPEMFVDFIAVPVKCDAAA